MKRRTLAEAFERSEKFNETKKSDPETYNTYKNLLSRLDDYDKELRTIKRMMFFINILIIIAVQIAEHTTGADYSSYLWMGIAANIFAGIIGAKVVKAGASETIDTLLKLNFSVSDLNKIIHDLENLENIKRSQEDNHKEE